MAAEGAAEPGWPQMHAEYADRLRQPCCLRVAVDNKTSGTFISHGAVERRNNPRPLRASAAAVSQLSAAFCGSQEL